MRESARMTDTAESSARIYLSHVGMTLCVAQKCMEAHAAKHIRQSGGSTVVTAIAEQATEQATDMWKKQEEHMAYLGIAQRTAQGILIHPQHD